MNQQQFDSKIKDALKSTVANYAHAGVTGTYPYLLKRAREELRDTYLIDAAVGLPGCPRERAMAILGRVRKFANQRRKRWAINGIPKNASREEAALAHAFFTRAQMPDRIEAFEIILAQADRPNKNGRVRGANACSDKDRTDHKGEKQS
ncbi:MAG TPA: hypothetical protein PKD77_12165 [Rudaea sp.]|jgi:hypothetical protein|nr:hypothetical protein [Rudaea sp.]